MNYSVMYKNKRGYTITSGVLFWEGVLRMAELYGVIEVSAEGEDLTQKLRQEQIDALPF